MPTTVRRRQGRTSPIAPGGGWGPSPLAPAGEASLSGPMPANDNLLDALEVIEYEDDEFHTDRLMSPDEIRDLWFE